jgi:hypothetical protein
VLAAAVWHRRTAADVDDEVLAAAHALARRNEVEGLLARMHPDRLRDALTDVEERSNAFRRNLRQVGDRLSAAGLQPILIKADPAADYEYSNFDIVVGRDGWAPAIRALEGFFERVSSDVTEPNKLILHPRHGPAAHLHAAVSWFNVPAVSLAGLRARAIRRPDESWWTPAPPDALRIALAHAAFQTLAFDLRDLLGLRALLTERDVVRDAQHAAASEGWSRGHRMVLRAAMDAMRRLDAEEAVALPRPLPVTAAILVAAEHASHLWRTRLRTEAVREALLRPALIATKRVRAAA